MFPYPSGAGLHVGHPEGYTATDILARYKRMRGFNVLHPWAGTPSVCRPSNTPSRPASIRRSPPREYRPLQEAAEALGFAYDWEREVNTTDPGFLPLDAVDFPPALQ